ncbi:MAG: DUF1028 domain-containing protein [Candidatus Nanopelagicales bacterium]
MTFSIVARSDDGTELGVAVASKFLAVGAVVPAAEPGAGAIATQALANLRYRPDGLALLRSGHDAERTLDRLVSADPGAADRQAGVVDASGRSATYTGPACFPWAGGVAGDGFAAQGNILTGPEVVDAVAGAWRSSDPGAPLARRLHAALLAGDRAGGDRRGRQSAAVLVVRPGGGYGGGSDVVVDLRVDDHADPVAELGRLLDLHDLLFGQTPEEDCLPLEGETAAELRDLLVRLGYDDPDLGRALEACAGVENLEERMRPGLLDPVVLAHLRTLAGVSRP